MNEKTSNQPTKKRRFIKFLSGFWSKPLNRWLIITLVLYVFLLQHIIAAIFGKFGIMYPTLFWEEIIEACETIALCTERLE